MVDEDLPQTTVLILSADATAAALLAALVETLGYAVRFARPPEPLDDALRRTRPKICLIDCTDPAACREEILARAVMRGVCVVILGTADVLARFRDLTKRLGLETLVLPPDPAELEAMLERAVRGEHV